MTAWPTGYGKRVLAQIDSTLDEARRIAGELAGPEWILALNQTAARGRRGRAWQMPKGNFAATLVLCPNEAPATAALRSFVAALALRDAVRAVAGPKARLSLKWPNDVLLNDGKLAGILLESMGQGAGMSHLAIGIGVNLAAAPAADMVEQGSLRPVSLSEETGQIISPEDFLTELSAAYAQWELQFTQFGFAPIRSAWMADAAKLGQVIIARTGTQELTGSFVDVDSEGQLVLETANGRQRVPAADVFF